MSAPLAEQQSALLRAIVLGGDSNATELIASNGYFASTRGQLDVKNAIFNARGLLAYRANASELAKRSLAANHPVILRLLGEEAAQHLARDVWRAHPPQRSDLAQWGGDLAHYMQTAPALASVVQAYPFLPDVARLEWALHQAATAADAQLDSRSLQLLAEMDPQFIGLRCSPGCALVESAYPIVAICMLHDPRYEDAHSAAQEAIAMGQAQTALVWRRGLRPMLRCAGAAECALLSSALQGESVASSVNAALQADANFDLSAWLATSVQSGLLCCIAEI